MRHTRAAALLPAAALLLLATACSSDDNGRDDTPSASSQEAGNGGKEDEEAVLKETVQKYVHAYFANDPDTGYEMVSERCQKKISKSTYAQGTSKAHYTYGQKKPRTLTVDKISGDLARVSYGFGVSELEREEQPWTREDGQWKWDAC